MGLLDILNGMQNGPRGQTAPGKGGMSPITMGLLALLAYKAYQKFNAQPGAAPAGNTNTAAPAGGGLLGGNLGGAMGGGLGGLLGGLLGGGQGGSMLNGGLNDLLGKLQQNGLGDLAQSWVGTGANHAISPDDLGKTIDDDTLNTLAAQSGMSRTALLDKLSQELPHAVDHITPGGRVPTDDEMSKLL